MRSLPLAILCLATMMPAAGGDAAVGAVPSADGVSIAYQVVGEGDPTLVLVHGWSCDRGYWKAQIADLGARYRLVLIDLAGHGDSGRSRREYTMAAFGADVAAVVEHLDLSQVVLVGHSMGGDVVVEAARLLPGRVKGMVWVDTYKSLGAGNTDEQIEAFAAKFERDFAGTTNAFVHGMFGPGADRVLVDRVAADMASAPPAIALSALRNSFRHSRVVAAALDALKLPVVAINSDRDPTDHASLERHGVRAFVLPDSGHFPMMEDPPRFNRSLDTVIRGLAE